MRTPLMALALSAALLAACGTTSETYAVAPALEGDSWVQPGGSEQPLSDELTLVEFFAPT